MSVDHPSDISNNTRTKGPTAQTETGHRDQAMQLQVERGKTYMTRFDGIAYSLFGEFYDERRDSFGSIERYLQQARIPIDSDLYLSRMTLGTIVASGFFLLLLTPVLIGLSITGTLDGFLPLPAPFDVITLNAIIVFTSGILSVLSGLGATYLNLSFRASSRKRYIDQTVPYAVTFMYALSRGGMNFVEVLRVLADSEDAYGEVSLEVRAVLRDMDYLSVDLPRAIRRGAQRSPSTKFEEFMSDIVSVIDSGGNLTTFLRDKSEEYMEESEREQESFLTTLALLGEVYVTAFVAGPLFLIIITVVMSMLGGSAITQLYGIVYGLLPLMNFIFFILIDTITVDEDSQASTIETRRIEQNAEDIKEKYADYIEEHEDSRVNEIIEAKEYRERSQVISDPIGWMLEKPIRSAAFSGPIALLYFVLALIIQVVPLSIDAMFNQPTLVTSVYIIVPIYIVAVPLSIVFEISNRRERKILNRLPDALKQLASANAIGMTLTESLNSVAKSTSGSLGKELGKVKNDIRWKNDVNGALVAFANRVKLAMVARTIKLITKANQSTGDIANVLDVAAKDVGKQQKLKKERANEMIMYTVVVLISYAVYLFVIAMLDSAFLSEIAKIASEGGGNIASNQPGGGGGAAINISDLPIQKFRMVFYHSTIIQALGSGLLAGKLGKDELLSGLKFSILLMAVSTGLFFFL